MEISWAECSCDPEYSHHCYLCGGTGRIAIEVERKETFPNGFISTEGTPLQMNQFGKVYATLDEKELNAIAKAVVDEMYHRSGKQDPSKGIGEISL